jgi:hypothetical protein
MIALMIVQKLHTLIAAPAVSGISSVNPVKVEFQT